MVKEVKPPIRMPPQRMAKRTSGDILLAQHLRRRRAEREVEWCPELVIDAMFSEEDAEYVRSLAYLRTLLDDYRDTRITGPANESTRRRALESLLTMRKELGGDRVDIGRYLSVSPNYYVEPINGWGTDEMRVSYVLHFELYFHAPLYFGTKYTPIIQTMSGLNCRLRRDKGIVLRDERPDRYGDVLIGRLTNIVIDPDADVATVTAGSPNTRDFFEVTFSLNSHYLPDMDTDRNWRPEQDRPAIIDDMGGDKDD